jgi:hypothetical protein
LEEGWEKKLEKRWEKIWERRTIKEVGEKKGNRDRENNVLIKRYRSARLELHESGIIGKPFKKDINRYVLFIFYFWSRIFDKSSKFWAAPCKKASNPPDCLDHGLHVLKPRSFSPNRAPKLWARHQLFFGLRLASKEFHHSAIQAKIEMHFGRFFYQMKVRQPIARQDSLQTLIRTSWRLESFLHEAAQNFEVFSNYFTYCSTTFN